MNDKQGINKERQLFEQIKALYEHHDIPTVTAALDLVAETYSLKKVDDGLNRVGCQQPFLPYHADPKSQPDPLFDQLASYVTADRSRTYLADGTLGHIAALVDLMTGRTEQAKVIGGQKTPTEYEEIEQAARQFVREHGAPINVVIEAFDSPSDAAGALRTLADQLEQITSLTVTHADIEAATGFRPNPKCICKLESTQVGRTEWDSNRQQRQRRRNIYRCRYWHDCRYNTYTKYGEWKWVTIWENGDPTNSPPGGSVPDYTAVPWTNACAVLRDPSGILVSSGFGWRGRPATWHPGIDLDVDAGTEVYPSEDGVLVGIKATNTEKPSEIGVWVQTGSHIRQYWHVNPAPGLKQGQQVKAGQTLLGKVTTYNPADPSKDHLHFVMYEPSDLSKWWEWDRRRDARHPCPENDL